MGLLCEGVGESALADVEAIAEEDMLADVDVEVEGCGAEVTVVNSLGRWRA